jgi:hypothetical protein
MWCRPEGPGRLGTYYYWLDSKGFGVSKAAGVKCHDSLIIQIAKNGVIIWLFGSQVFRKPVVFLQQWIHWTVIRRFSAFSSIYTGWRNLDFRQITGSQDLWLVLKVIMNHTWNFTFTVCIYGSVSLPAVCVQVYHYQQCVYKCITTSSVRTSVSLPAVCVQVYHYQQCAYKCITTSSVYMYTCITTSSVNHNQLVAEIWTCAAHSMWLCVLVYHECYVEETAFTSKNLAVFTQNPAFISIILWFANTHKSSNCLLFLMLL